MVESQEPIAATETALSVEEPLAAAAPAGAPVGGAAPPSMDDRPRSLTKEEVERIRTEMKISLAVLYAAQKSFWAETGRYSTDLKAVGFTTQGKELWSKLGFLSPYSPPEILGKEDPRVMDTDSLFRESDPAKAPRLRFTARPVDLGSLARFCRQGCTATADQFEIIAAAQLMEGYPPDVWLITEKKTIRSVSNGLSPTGTWP